MTTKHHEGFCLWDTDADRLQRGASAGPGATWCASTWRPAASSACKVGFYYSLMDWHHPDGARCATDETARRRFLDFTQGCVRELMTNYGKIDILWYDVSWPLETPELWESAKMNAMVARAAAGHHHQQPLAAARGLRHAGGAHHRRAGRAAPGKPA